MMNSNYIKMGLALCTCLYLFGKTIGQDLILKQELSIPTTEVSKIDGVEWSSAIATSQEGHIFWAYINPRMEAVIAMKDYNTGEIKTNIIHGGVKNDDNHAELSIGLDNDGYIHYLGNHHNSSPNYYISKRPGDISSWVFKGNDIEKGGLEGTGITYQSFYRSNNGTLFVAYRTIVHKSLSKGSRGAALAKYNTSTKKWTMIGSLNYCLDGLDCEEHCGTETGITAFAWDNSGSGGGSCSPCGNFGFYQGYKVKIVFDTNNVMHCTWNISKNVFTTSNPAEFHTHVMYAKSPDEGETWYRADNSQIVNLPITCETGDTTSDGDVVFTEFPEGYPNDCSTPLTDWSMTNGGRIFLDSNGKPVISCTVLTETGNWNATEGHFLRWNGTTWEDITSDFSMGDGKIFSNRKGMIYELKWGKVFLSTDNGVTKTSFDLDYKYDYNAYEDQYYLAKTGKLRFYAKSGEEAKIVTLSADYGVARPELTPEHQIHGDSVNLFINTSTPGATIWYTTDGANPETNGTEYTGSITLKSDSRVKTVASKEGLLTSNMVDRWYYVNDPCMSKLNVSLVSASDYQDPNKPENTLDGDLQTRWSAEGEHWIQYQLDTLQQINTIYMSFYSGNTRQAIFDVETSTDGINWEPVLSNVFSSGETANLEKFGLNTTLAKYVRINAHGNSTSGWNSIQEVEIWGGCANPAKYEYLLTTSAYKGTIEITPVNNSAYNEGALVTAWAKADPGYSFKRWDNAITVKDNPVTFAMTSDKVLSAIFTRLPFGDWYMFTDTTYTNTFDGDILNTGEIAWIANDTTETKLLQDKVLIIESEGKINAGFENIFVDRFIDISNNPVMGFYARGIDTFGSVDSMKYYIILSDTSGTATDEQFSVKIPLNRGWHRYTINLADATIDLSGISKIGFKYAGEAYTTYELNLDDLAVGEYPREERLFMLRTLAGTGGEISPESGMYSDTVIVTATASEGYSFSHWSRDAEGSENPLVIVMEEDITVIANFVPWPTAIQATGKQPGLINIYPNPSGLHNKITLELDGFDPGVDVEIFVVDISGRVITSAIKYLPSTHAKLNIETSGLKEGMYIVSVRINKQVTNKKLFIN